MTIYLSHLAQSLKDDARLVHLSEKGLGERSRRRRRIDFCVSIKGQSESKEFLSRFKINDKETLSMPSTDQKSNHNSRLRNMSSDANLLFRDCNIKNDFELRIHDVF